MKNKRVMTLLWIAALSIVVSGCQAASNSNESMNQETKEESAKQETDEGSGAQETKEEPATEDSAKEESDEEDAKADDLEETKAGSSVVVREGGLPPYEYPGPEKFYSVLYQYITQEVGKYYEPSDVGIPCPVIVYVDETNPEEIRVYGDFEYFNYKLKDDTLKTKSGGNHPGVITLRTTDDGYEVTKIDYVVDGEGYTESAKELFGEHYDDFAALESNFAERERIRCQIVANYVADHELDIKKVQDFGWDPVELPEENIDTFYTDL